MLRLRLQHQMQVSLRLHAAYDETPTAEHWTFTIGAAGTVQAWLAAGASFEAVRSADETFYAAGQLTQALRLKDLLLRPFTLMGS